MRYRNRKPYKVNAAMLEALRRLRANGKSYRLCGELAGVACGTAFKWLRAPSTREA